jgi:hypothetical protein
MSQAAAAIVSSGVRFASPRPSRSRQSRAELLKLAASSGAIGRFIEIMGGPREFGGCDEDDIRAFIRENAP